MKQGTGRILLEAQERYLERLQPPRDPLLREMEAFASEHDVPIADPEVGRFLEVVTRSQALAGRARRVLEIGTAIGYGTLLLARSAPEAWVVSLDRDPEMLAKARGYLEREGVADRVELVEGDALPSIERLDGPFDLVWVDATKTEYRHYLDRLLPKVVVGGVMLFDNLLWKGRVADPDRDLRAGDEGEVDEAADALRSFNGYLMIHPQLRAQVLALGDGVGIATKIAPTIMEAGGPF
jgi:predicted O-methyltransferase YrrM